MHATLWRAQLARRLATHRPIKIPATVFGIAAFFVAYFWVMSNPAPWTTLREVPPLSVDHWLAVHEWAIVPYGTLWLYVVLAPALAADLPEMRSYTRGALAICAIGLAIFWLFPTAVPHFEIDWRQYPMLEFLKNRDGRANAFPSLHVAFATFTALVLNAQLRACDVPAGWRIGNAAWGALIAWSALATRQHVALDAMAGAALGGLVYLPLRAIRRRPTAGAPSHVDVRVAGRGPAIDV